MASAYGHMRVEGRLVDDDGKFVTARGTAWDVENNVLIAYETKRRVTGKAGKRFSDDMIVVTGNAATSIAIRNAIFKAIPKAYWGPVYDACKKAAVGDASTLANRRVQMLQYFVKLGATNDQVLALLGVRGVEDITLDHMATLKGLATAIKDGDTTVDEAFAAAPAVQRASAAVAPGAVAVVAADTLVIVGKVLEMEETADSHYWLTTATGERLLVEKDTDAAELVKFGGTDHQLQFTCRHTAIGPVLQSFVIAD